MEYILEELLRQRKALAALMTGGTPEEQEDRDSESSLFGGPEQASLAVSGYQGSVRQNGGDALLDGMLPDTLEGDGAAVLLREAGTDEAGAALPMDQKTTGGAVWQPAWSASQARELPWSARLSMENGMVETVSGQTAAWWSGRTVETDAKALSRAVQRDARRYDGGFNAR